MPSRYYSIADLRLLCKENVGLSEQVTKQLKFFGLFVDHSSLVAFSKQRIGKRPSLRYSNTELLLLRDKPYTYLPVSEYVEKRLKVFNLYRKLKPLFRMPYQYSNLHRKDNKSQLTCTSKLTNRKHQSIEKVDLKKIDVKEKACIDRQFSDAVYLAFPEEDGPVLSFTQGRSRRFIAPSREEMIAFLPVSALLPRSRASGATGAPPTASAEVSASATSEPGPGLGTNSFGGSNSTQGEQPSFDSSSVIVESPLHNLHERLLANSNDSDGWVRIRNLEEKLVKWIVKAFPEKSMEDSEDDMCLTFWSLLDSYGDAIEIISSYPKSIDIRYRSKDSCMWAQESLDGQYLFTNDVIQCFPLDKK